nr:partial threonyl-tRNA synthetase (HrrS) [uncultured archaeon]
MILMELKNREEVVKNIQSRRIILLPDGTELPVDLSKEDEVMAALAKAECKPLEAYVVSEELKRPPGIEPPSVKIMQQHELVGYEPSSDSGNFRFYPKGYLIFQLLHDWANEIAVNRFKALQIDSPLLYAWDDPQIREQAGTFHERHYSVRPPDSDREFILRFAGDFGLFKIMKDATISYRNLPLRMYEFSKSFRYERSGELSGLKRLRAFHMPDIHCFCRDMEEGWTEYQELYRNYSDLADASGVEYAIVFRIVESFYNENRSRIVDLVKYSNQPAFIEVLSEAKHYWAVKNEFQGVDSTRGCIQLSTVQLDVKDAQVYGIDYTDRDGKKKGCIICHSSIGSIERWYYSLLEEALKKEQPTLPVWLSPTQVRIIPVSEKQLEYCRYLDIDGVRYDVDDSDETLAKKIAKASTEWIPYVAVVGDREAESGVLSVSIRETGKRVTMTREELAQEVRRHCAGRPYRPLALPKLLSQRPAFK